MERIGLGEMEYGRALAMQLESVDRRARGETPDTLLLLTHPHVCTFGRRGVESNLLASEESLRKEGIAVERVSRGGKITYHGPGQLVGSPIVNLARADVHEFVRVLEAALIESLGRLGVTARAIRGLTGVWVGEKKIASIGVAVRRRVTCHGFALNVTTDLSYFRRIHLCGLKGKEATSISEVLARDVEMGSIRDVVAKACGRRLEGIA